MYRAHVKVSRSFTHNGSHAVEITIHEGDIEQAGDANTRVERDELDSGHFPLLGQEAWYGFSLLIPTDFPILDERLVISSCKQTDVSRPLAAQRFRNGRHTLTVEARVAKRNTACPQFRWASGWTWFTVSVIRREMMASSKSG